MIHRRYHLGKSLSWYNAFRMSNFRTALILSVFCLLGVATAKATKYLYEGKTEHVKEFNLKRNNPKRLFMSIKAPRVVEFYSPHCPACKAFAPSYMKLASNTKKLYPEIQFFAVSCDHHEDVCDKYGIGGYPTIRLLKEDDGPSSKGKLVEIDEYEAEGERARDQIAKYLGVKSTGGTKVVKTLVERELDRTKNDDDDDNDNGTSNGERDNNDGDGDDNYNDNDDDEVEKPNDKSENNDDGNTVNADKVEKSNDKSESNDDDIAVNAKNDGNDDDKVSKSNDEDENDDDGNAGNVINGGNDVDTSSKSVDESVENNDDDNNSGNASNDGNDVDKASKYVDQSVENNDDDNNSGNASNDGNDDDIASKSVDDSVQNNDDDNNSGNASNDGNDDDIASKSVDDSVQNNDDDNNSGNASNDGNDDDKVKKSVHENEKNDNDDNSGNDSNDSNDENETNVDDNVSSEENNEEQAMKSGDENRKNADGNTKQKNDDNDDDDDDDGGHLNRFHDLQKAEKERIMKLRGKYTRGFGLRDKLGTTIKRVSFDEMTDGMKRFTPGTKEYLLRKEAMNKRIKKLGRRYKHHHDPDSYTKATLPLKKYEPKWKFLKLRKLNNEEELILDVTLSLKFSLSMGLKMGIEDVTSKKAMRDWLNLLSVSLPPEWDVNRLVDELKINFEHATESTENFREILRRHPVHQDAWSPSCINTKLELEGFTCGFWKLLHVVTLGVVEQRGGKNLIDSGMMSPKTVVFSPASTADTIRNFIDKFFTCRPCREHFLQTYDDCENHRRCDRLSANKAIQNAASWKELSMWLWEFHNDVSVRLVWQRISKTYTKEGVRNTPTSSQQVAMIFPNVKNCIACFNNDGTWNEAEVFGFLERTYWPDSENDPLTDKLLRPENEGILASALLWFISLLFVGMVYRMTAKESLAIRQPLITARLLYSRGISTKSRTS